MANCVFARCDQNLRAAASGADGDHMDWNDIRTFLAVAKSGSITGASKELEVNPSTVSRRVNSMEERLGVRLFDRLPSGYAPTAAGEEMLYSAELMNEEASALELRLSGRDTRLTGRLRVALLDSDAVRYMPVLQEFRALYPGIELVLVTSIAMSDLSRREADVALRHTDQPHEYLVGRRLARIGYALYGALSLVEQVGSLHDLEAFPWLAWHERAGARITEQWMAEHVPNAQIVCRFDSVPAMIEGLRLGMGICYVPCAEGELISGVRRLRPPMDSFGMNFWILTHPDLRTTARVRAFRDFMAERITSIRDLLEGRRLRNWD